MPKRDLDEYFYALDEEVHGATRILKLPSFAVQGPGLTKQGKIPRNTQAKPRKRLREINDSWPVRKVKHTFHKGSWNRQSETSVVYDPIISDSIQVAFFEGRVKLDKFIAAGANGKVYKCFCDIPAFGGSCAVKIAAKQSEQLKNEIDILKSLSHEKILTYYGSAETDRHLRLFMEYMPGGSLAAHIKERKVLNEDDSRKFTLQILQAVSYIHSQGIIHRDVKGSNVLLDQFGNIKVADFGLSRRIQITGSKGESNVLSYCGTPYWMAPEVIRGEGYERRADIWSLGCTSVEMLTGSPPLGHLNPQAASFKIGSGPIVLTLPQSVSQDAKDFIKVALTWDPEDRPWSHELLRHRFLLPK